MHAFDEAFLLLLLHAQYETRHGRTRRLIRWVKDGVLVDGEILEHGTTSWTEGARPATSKIGSSLLHIYLKNKTI